MHNLFFRESNFVIYCQNVSNFLIDLIISAPKFDSFSKIWKILPDFVSFQMFNKINQIYTKKIKFSQELPNLTIKYQILSKNAEI